MTIEELNAKVEILEAALKLNEIKLNKLIELFNKSADWSHLVVNDIKQLNDYTNKLAEFVSYHAHQFNEDRFYSGFGI